MSYPCNVPELFCLSVIRDGFERPVVDFVGPVLRLWLESGLKVTTVVQDVLQNILDFVEGLKAEQISEQQSDSPEAKAE